MYCTKPLSIVAFYERNCGGETIATEHILSELRKKKTICVIKRVLSPLRTTDFVSYTWWIADSVFLSLIFLFKYRKQCSLVYTTTYTAGVAAVISRLFSRHDIYFHYHGNRIPPISTKASMLHSKIQKIKQYIVYRLHVFFLQYTQRIITPSLSAKISLIHQFPRLSYQDIHVIPNGVDLNEHTSLPIQRRQSLRKIFHIPNHYRVLSYIGRLEEQKHIMLLVEIFYDIQRSVPYIMLYIAHPPLVSFSERIYKQKLEKYIQTRGLESRVKFISPRGSTSAIYAVFDIIISLSEKETSSLVLFEAWASKCIFMGSAIAPFIQFLRLVDSRLILKSRRKKSIAHAIISILHLSQREQWRLKRKAYNVIRQFQWNTTANRILDTFSY